MNLPIFYVDDLIQRAITEDINYIDVTSDYLLEDDDMSQAYWVSKDSGVVAGLDIGLRVFTLLDPAIVIETKVKDGDRVEKGDILATMEGPTKSLLKGERTALNLVQHMSGIATATRRCVDLVAGIQKYAVVCGGGRNHRYNLSDAAMLKDNHIDAYGSLTKAVETLRSRTGHMVKIECETRTLEELQEALDCGVDVIMLDNMDLPTMKKAVELTAGRAKLEASGNITEENIAQVAATGVDIISLGALTHSVKCFDISMKIKRKEN